MIQRLLKQDWGNANVVWDIQFLEGGKAGERPIIDDGDNVLGQAPVKARYELAW